MSVMSQNASGHFSAATQDIGAGCAGQAEGGPCPVAISITLYEALGVAKTKNSTSRLGCDQPVMHYVLKPACLGLDVTIIRRQSKFMPLRADAITIGEYHSLVRGERILSPMIGR
jgi:hypothetical protein